MKAQPELKTNLGKSEACFFRSTLVVMHIMLVACLAALVVGSSHLGFASSINLHLFFSLFFFLFFCFLSFYCSHKVVVELVELSTFQLQSL